MKNTKPILFNSEMTKAILNGRKVQTRRLAKVYDVDPYFVMDNVDEVIKKHSRYKKGDTLWVREPVRIIEYSPVGNYGGSWNDEDFYSYEYVTDGSICTSQEIPERFSMIPKWIEKKQGVPNGCIKEMARIFLKVTDVRIKKLQDISLGDIHKEGFDPEKGFASPLEWWIHLWDSNVGRLDVWTKNPYVFVYEFAVEVKD